MTMTNILFTRTTDSQSKVLKMILRKKGIEFEERNIDTQEYSKADVLAAAPDARKVPVLIMDGAVIGGLRAASIHLKALAEATPASPFRLAAQAAMPKLGRQS
jgi:hypothetical protein